MNLQLNRLIHTIVADYRSLYGAKACPTFKALDYTDKKSLLFYLLDSDEEYLRVINNPIAFDAACKEYINFINPLLEDEFNEQYASILYDNGLRPHTDQINGEVTWY